MTAEERTDWIKWGLDKIGLPVIVWTVGAAFAVGVVWTAFGDTRHDVEILEVRHAQELVGHPQIVQRIESSEKHIEALEEAAQAAEERERQVDRRLIAICIATKADCGL